MDLSPTSLAVALIICTAIYKYIVHPLLLTSLSRVPAAHPLCHVTDQLSAYLERREQDLDWLLAAHKAKGPVVRVGPTSVNVNSADALRSIYTSLDKHTFYSDFTSYNGTQNMFCTLNGRLHSERRKLLSSVYSNSYLQRSEDVKTIYKTMLNEGLLPMMCHFADTGRKVNIFQLFVSLGIDFNTAYAFGLDDSTRLLQNRGHEGQPYQSGNVADTYESQDPRDLDWFAEDECLSLVMTAVKNMTENKASSTTKPVVFEKLYTGLSAQKPPLSPETLLLRCASEIRDHIVGSEPLAITLTYVFYYLSKTPDMQSRLRQELITSDLSNLERLPFLNAVITEAIRLNAPGPARLRRVAPAQGLTVHDYYLPANTTISSASYILHRNASVFPKPEAFHPERWLDASDDMKRWWWGFGSGSRMCIGDQLALIIVRGVLATVYGANLRTWVVDDRGVEQTKTFIASPRDRRLILGVGRVEQPEDGMNVVTTLD